MKSAKTIASNVMMTLKKGGEGGSKNVSHEYTWKGVRLKYQPTPKPGIVNQEGHRGMTIILSGFNWTRARSFSFSLDPR